jgi:hypothetical protein
MPRRKKNAPLFEEHIGEIDNEINKRKSRWTLTALSWFDFDDVAQILRIHIFKKWHLYDASRPLAPWINTVISSQIKNLIRNMYYNFSRPCLKCAAAEGDDLCNIYTKQCSTCPLYARWEKTKKRAYDTKLPVPLDNHTQEVFNRYEDTIDIERTAPNIHKRMEEILKPSEWKCYKLLFIEHKSEEEAAAIMGFKTSEKHRAPGYKQIKNLRKTIMKKVKESLNRGEIDIL